MVDINAHGVEPHDDRTGQTPLQKDIHSVYRCPILLTQVPKPSNTSLKQRQQALKGKQHDQEILEEYVIVADCFDLGVHNRVHDCIEHLRGESEDEESRGAGLMPFLVHLASVDGGSVSH